MPTNSLSDLRKFILGFLNEGWSLVEVARQHNLEWENVSRLMRRADKSINYSPVKNFARYRSAILASRVRTMRKLGFSFEDIGKEMGKSAKWVRDLHYKEPIGSPTIWLEITENVRTHQDWIPPGRYRLNCSAYCNVGHLTDAENNLHYVRLSNLKGKVAFPEGQLNKTD